MSSFRLSYGGTGLSIWNGAFNGFIISVIIPMRLEGMGADS
jgi:hypothetical protein